MQLQAAYCTIQIHVHTYMVMQLFFFADEGGLALLLKWNTIEISDHKAVKEKLALTHCHGGGKIPI